MPYHAVTCGQAATLVMVPNRESSGQRISIFQDGSPLASSCSLLFPMPNDIENQRITIVPTGHESRHRSRECDCDLTLMTHRTLSIHAPIVPLSALLPIEYRTLSLHLEHRDKSAQGSNGKAKNKVRGRSSPTC